MRHQIDLLIRRYEKGKLTRRELVDGIAALAAAPAAGAQPLLEPKNINHVTMAVSDLGKSREFYQKLLHAPIVGQSSFEIDLGLGAGFIALMKMDRPPGVDHFCIGVANYDAGQVAKMVEARGVKTQTVNGFGGVTFREPQVYVRDPDGVRVQFARPDYRGEMNQGR